MVTNEARLSVGLELKDTVLRLFDKFGDVLSEVKEDSRQGRCSQIS